MNCPICKEEHGEEYLEFSKIKKHEKDEWFYEYYYIYVYCNYADMGLSFISENDDRNPYITHKHISKLYNIKNAD